LKGKGVEYRFQSQGKEYVVALESGPEGIRAWVDGRERRFRLHPARDGTLDLEVDGRRHRISCARDGSSLHLACEGEGYRLQKLDPLSPRAPQQHEHGLEAPMPGLVRRVAVVAGETVRRGQTLVVLEAMKMEIRITAPEQARVIKLHCGAGDQVDRGQVLVDLDATGGKEG